MISKLPLGIARFFLSPLFAISLVIPAANSQDTDKTLASQLLVWRMDSQKDPLTDAITTNPTSTKTVRATNGVMFAFIATAGCGDNGVSVFFKEGGDPKNPPPVFLWYVDRSDNSGEQVADVRMTVDGGGVHVAQGYPEKVGHTLNTASLGLLFYQPNLVAQVARDQENRANTGILALDGLVAPMVRQAANANAQEWAANSAGPLSNLVNARSIRVDLALADGSNPVLDLNPQDKVLHQFVTDCNARFTGRSQSSPATTPAQPAAQPRRK